MRSDPGNVQDAAIVEADAATDRWIVKGILGRRFDWGRQKKLSPLLRHQRHLADGLFAHRQPLDEIRSHIVTTSGRIGNGNLAFR